MEVYHVKWNKPHSEEKKWYKFSLIWIERKKAHPKSRKGDIRKEERDTGSGWESGVVNMIEAHYISYENVIANPNIVYN